MSTKTNDPKQTAPEAEPVVDDIKTEPVTPDAEEKADKKTAQKEGKEKEPKASKEPKESKEKKETKKEIEADLAAEKDKYLRLLAEYDNYRKRTAKEKESLYTDAKIDTIKALLGVYDNLERGLAQYGDEESPHRKGLEMVFNQFKESLKKLGVETMDAAGKPFDPEKHNAVMHVEDENYGENTVVEVLQQGFTLGDKVLRFAIVKVAN